MLSPPRFISRLRSIGSFETPISGVPVTSEPSTTASTMIPELSVAVALTEAAFPWQSTPWSFTTTEMFKSPRLMSSAEFNGGVSVRSLNSNVSTPSVKSIFKPSARTV